MKKVILLLVLFTGSLGFSQNSNNSTLNKPYIEVTGKAEKEIIPDEIYISITLKERVARSKKITIQQQESDLKKQLTMIGIPIENLSIADVNATILKTGWFSKDILATANYILKVSDASKLKKVFETFKKSKVHQSRIKKVSHSKIIELKKQNRIAAIKAAKEKANYLLTAVGEKVGRPMLVTENTHYNDGIGRNFNAYNVQVRAEGYYGDRAKKQTPIQFEKIRITSTIYVKFEIK